MHSKMHLYIRSSPLPSGLLFNGFFLAKHSSIVYTKFGKETEEEDMGMIKEL
jgi:hypothetical protein